MIKKIKKCVQNSISILSHTNDQNLKFGKHDDGNHEIGQRTTSMHEFSHWTHENKCMGFFF